MLSVSVVIPTYNRSHLISRAIDSVLAQTYKASEIIIIDDGSSDDTHRVVKEYSDKVQYFYQENSGVSVARNFGANIAKSEWIAFLDSDDYWHEHKLRYQINAANSISDAGLIFTDLYHVASDSTIINRSMDLHSKGIAKVVWDQHIDLNYWVVLDKLLEASLYTFFLNPSSCMIKKDYVKLYGGYDSELKVAEDLELVIRYCKKNVKILYIPIPLVYQLQTTGSLSRNSNSHKQYIEVYLTLCNKLFCEYTLNESEYNAVNDMIKGIYLGEAWSSCNVGDYSSARMYALKCISIGMVYYGVKHCLMTLPIIRTIVAYFKNKNKRINRACL